MGNFARIGGHLFRIIGYNDEISLCKNVGHQADEAIKIKNEDLEHVSEIKLNSEKVIQTFEELIAFSPLRDKAILYAALQTIFECAEEK